MTTTTKPSTQAWNVFVAVSDGERLVDTVFATGYDAEEMRRSLVDHDGYHPSIYVREHDRNEVNMDASPALSKRMRGAQ